VSEVLRWDTVSIRKPCKCPLCGRTMPIKSRMVSAAWADGGTVFSEKFCRVCEEYWRSELNGEETTFDGDPIYGDDFETWETMRKKMEASI